MEIIQISENQAVKMANKIMRFVKCDKYWTIIEQWKDEGFIKKSALDQARELRKEYFPKKFVCDADDSYDSPENVRERIFDLYEEQIEEIQGG
jgi:hypothetical protein